jgi:hypothetical protein
LRNYVNYGQKRFITLAPVVAFATLYFLCNWPNKLERLSLAKPFQPCLTGNQQPKGQVLNYAGKACQEQGVTLFLSLW